MKLIFVALTVFIATNAFALECPNFAGRYEHRHCSISNDNVWPKGGDGTNLFTNEVVVKQDGCKQIEVIYTVKNGPQETPFEERNLIDLSSFDLKVKGSTLTAKSREKLKKRSSQVGTFGPDSSSQKFSLELVKDVLTVKQSTKWMVLIAYLIPTIGSSSSECELNKIQ